MKEKISALMDGELDEGAARVLIEGLHGDREALECWRHYHLISDSMRDSVLLSEGFAARLGERLAAEPTVMAPRTLMGVASRPSRAFPAAIAAGAAAVAFVGWLAFVPQPQPQNLAQIPGPAKNQPPSQPIAKSAGPAIVPLPTAANDYLLAHQGFSPRMSLQGMAPYVRTVADTQEARK